MSLHRVAVSLMLAVTCVLMLMHVSTLPSPPQRDAAEGTQPPASALEAPATAPAGATNAARPLLPDCPRDVLALRHLA